MDKPNTVPAYQTNAEELTQQIEDFKQANPDIVEAMHSGLLVRSESASELTHALSFMLEHDTELAAYPTALHDRVMKEFSFEEMVSAVEKLYSEK